MLIKFPGPWSCHDFVSASKTNYGDPGTWSLSSVGRENYIFGRNRVNPYHEWALDETSSFPTVITIRTTLKDQVLLNRRDSFSSGRPRPDQTEVWIESGHLRSCHWRTRTEMERMFKSEAQATTVAESDEPSRFAFYGSQLPSAPSLASGSTAPRSFTTGLSESSTYIREHLPTIMLILKLKGGPNV